MTDETEMIARVDSALEQVETEMEAEECHGTLTGLFCARGVLKPEEWLEYIAHALDPNNLLAREALETFKSLYEKTRKELSKLERLGPARLAAPENKRNATKTKTGTRNGQRPASVRSLTNRVTDAPDWRAANNRLYKCVRGRASRLTSSVSGRSTLS